ncbi:general transcription factor 3C polypeptide 6 [Carex littledalei]|uniref:General transcription factor 3C polypeptide 6 n=1 Tax=Carex littledalei TaxID=544730 RepID=A0A833VE61_9POAL|nr:general transcription factor 3C polypeptide 6 [Carex littledalei]
MEAYKEMDKQPDYEEEFVFLDLDDCVYSDIPPNAPFVLSGLDTPSPILQIGDHLKLIGEYQETIGTCYIFSESDALSNELCPNDQSHAPHKQVKPLASLQKILKFKVSAEDRSKAEVANKY